MTLDRIEHDLLRPLQHGFYGRAGGASSGIYEGLNCGLGSDDQQDIVLINRERVALDLGAAPSDMTGVHQIHSADVVTVDHAMPERPKADALVTKVKGVVLSVLTADCQPVLFADHQNGVIGAAHAGWQGALNGVLEATIDAMVAIGGSRDSIAAVIGPCISQRNYEVGPEFMERIMDEDTDKARFFAGGHGDRVQFDLPSFGLARLRDAGITQAAWTGHCTYADSNRFYSYRRSVHQKQADYGRLIGAIRL